MDFRRTSIAVVLLAAILTVASITPAHAARVVLRFHTWASPQSTDFRDTLLPWIRRIENQSKGQIRFDVYPSMALGGQPEDLFEQVRSGRADVVWTRPAISGSRFERLEAFELPFLANDAEALSRAYWEYSQAYVADAFDGVRLLALHVGGPALIHARGQPVASIAALKNLRISVPTRQAAKLLAALGAKPVLQDLASNREALRQRAIDAVLAPWDDMAGTGMIDKTMYHTVFERRALSVSTHMLAINLSVYESLPADLRIALDGGGGLQTSAALGRRYKTRSQSQLADRNSNRLIRVTPRDAQAFQKAAASVDAQWVKKITANGFDGQKLLDGARTLIKQHSD